MKRFLACALAMVVGAASAEGFEVNDASLDQLGVGNPAVARVTASVFDALRDGRLPPLSMHVSSRFFTLPFASCREGVGMMGPELSDSEFRERIARNGQLHESQHRLDIEVRRDVESLVIAISPRDPAALLLIGPAPRVVLSRAGGHWRWRSDLSSGLRAVAEDARRLDCA